MKLNTKTARPITIKEQESINYIESLLGVNPNEKILAFIQIKCATDDGFFDKMLKYAFKGFYTQNNNLRDKLATTNYALYMAERAIPTTKKKQKKFKEHFKDVILKGLKITKNYMNIDDVIDEYETLDKWNKLVSSAMLCTVKTKLLEDKMSEIKRIPNVFDVTKRLLGMIHPQGESNIDKVRYQNLEDTILVTDMLIRDLTGVSDNKDRQEYSMSKAGKKAHKYLLELKNILQDYE